MESKLKKYVPLGLLSVLLISVLYIYGLNKFQQKDEYLIMKPNNIGSYDITSKLMTSSEATKLKSSENVAVVEKDGIVTGSESQVTNSKNDFNNIQKMLEKKNKHKLITVSKKLRTVVLNGICNK